MNIKDIEATRKAFFEIEKAIERNAPIQEIRELFKNGDFHYINEEILQRDAAVLFEIVIQKYIVCEC